MEELQENPGPEEGGVARYSPGLTFRCLLTLCAAENPDPQGIFGVPLQASVRYANVAISLTDPQGNSYIYGYVPIVVAKCGVYLKEKGTVHGRRWFQLTLPATDVEGIFRLSGSEKRIKELQKIFNSPDRYGKGLDWTGYTVHDAANILRRYFNQLPEPIIPLDFYDRFRDPMRGYQSHAVGLMDGPTESTSKFDPERVIKTYQLLITQVPPLNRQLLLYILDLLAVFASKSDLNKMTTANLAAIFQPGILSHPNHDMAPAEYRLSQDVMIFLIEHQDYFLIGMQGTAADEKTVQEVESGPPTPQNRSSTPRHSKSTVVRSGSNSSRAGGVRRSVSASSRRSKNSAAQSPVGSDFQTPTASPVVGPGVHRSNTLPPTHSPNLGAGRFGRTKGSGKSTPDSIVEDLETEKGDAKAEKKPVQHRLQEVLSPTDGVFPASIPIPATSPEQKSTPARGLGASRQTPGSLALPSPNFHGPTSEQTTPTGAAKGFGIFGTRSPPLDGRRPNKLQKKRGVGSPFPSAHSSTNSLADAAAQSDQMAASLQQLAANPSLLTPPREHLPVHESPVLKSPPPIGGNLKPSMSPAASYRSQSDLEAPEYLQLQNESPDASSKRHYFFARDRKADVTSQPMATSVGSNGLAQRSRSSVLSGEDRKSTSIDRSATQQSTEAGPTSDSERESRKEKNPVRWIKGKLQDFAEKFDHPERTRDERRMVSPTRGQQQHQPMAMGTAALKPGSASPRRQQPSEPRSSMQHRPSGESRRSELSGGRGKSFDVPRTAAQAASPLRLSQEVPPGSRSPPVTSAEPGAAPTVVQAPVGGK